MTNPKPLKKRIAKNVAFPWERLEPMPKMVLTAMAIISVLRRPSVSPTLPQQ